jgi:hypothetical protein
MMETAKYTSYWMRTMDGGTEVLSYVTGEAIRGDSAKT